MIKQTPFSLFIRQALNYPLDIPFLPQESDVKLGVVYSAGQKTGSYAGGGSCDYPAEADVKKGVQFDTETKTGTYGPLPNDLEWQTVNDLAMSQPAAVIYAQYLDADGVTVDETPQNIWRLPKCSEAVYSCASYFFGGPSPLIIWPWEILFWSDYNFSGFAAYFGVQYGQTVANVNMDTMEYHVRCVKI